MDGLRVKILYTFLTTTGLCEFIASLISLIESLWMAHVREYCGFQQCDSTCAIRSSLLPWLYFTENHWLRNHVQ